MKKNIILICCLTLFLFATVSICYAFDFKAVKDLKKHPEFVSIESSTLRENLFINYEYDIDVKLKNGKSISFACIDKHGGGKYCCVSKIGDFSVDSRILVNNRQIPAAGINFIDLSNILKKEISSITDAIDNYDDILKFILNLAKKQYFLGAMESSWLDSYSCINNQKIIKKFPSNFSFKGNRKAVIFVETIKNYPQWVWDGIQDDEIQWCVNRYGENWREKLNNDLPKIRKSLGIEN